MCSREHLFTDLTAPAATPPGWGVLEEGELQLGLLNQ